MNVFLSELGKKLAERWLTLLVLPGLIYLTCAAIALTLGQRNALNPAALGDAVNRLAAQPSMATPGALVLLVAGVLAAAAAAGLAAAGLGRLTERVWNAEGRHRIIRPLTGIRRKRWDRADDRVREQIRSAAAAARDHARSGTPAPPAAQVAALIAARQEIGLTRPQRPTWIADRLRAADQRVHEAYDLDLTGAWPRLWLVIPDTARAELGTAHEAYASAARLTGWAVLYLPLTAWWWPALPITVTVAAVAWRRGRSSAGTLSDLIEATVDLYGRDLALQLGLSCEGPLSRRTGLAITATVRKDPETRHSAIGTDLPGPASEAGPLS
ncbi:hypothetical protein FHS43_001900 [Streptosporangium becharense]|uniref:Vegetative cell wall protein gp1 n=1 Tax=Streptosporangium becharense TaxID=1816182 RepID=A0A7W9MDW8_9ACTN|nr:hypothetical protein [Streptosporangium becharense]MBB2910637.1 hypothetical protein [Streptosporangium becharense]MBB5817332.1 hypothetical protein [Streptosporangium becharense]